MDTIYALSTAPGKAGVSIIRISGPEAFSACRAICGDLPKPRHASLRVLTDHEGQALDEALVILFPEKSSFTGEDVAELHVHGSIAVVSAVTRCLGGIPGLRPASAGEFTRRALENERLDLIQVEALGDLISSETEAQRRAAVALLTGALAEKCDEWRHALFRSLALLEAGIDFPEEDIPESVIDEVIHLISATSLDLDKQIKGFSSAERLRIGFEVAILGAPNVGKSTLLNTLAGRDAAITSEIAGTTRDVIEVRMEIGGLPVTLLDTAGLRETDDPVESIGVDRARDRASRADLRVFLLSGGDTPDALDVPARPDDILLYSKGDLLVDRARAISGKTGLGVQDLLDRVADILSRRTADAGLASRERHRLALLRGKDALVRALGLLRTDLGAPELAAEEIRVAIRALDSLIGRLDVEVLLDEIFKNFCIGK